jgi:hypothetical protein
VLADGDTITVFGAQFPWAEQSIDMSALQRAIQAELRATRRRALAFIADGLSSYRDMTTLGTLELRAHQPIFADVYEIVRRSLEVWLQEDVFAVDDKNEQYVINVLDRPFDEQGWHRDVYDYAVNYMLESPTLGGELEIELASSTYRRAMPDNTWYAMRTTLPHRVAPVILGRRIVFNCAYHSRQHGPAQSYSSQSLYSQ